MGYKTIVLLAGLLAAVAPVAASAAAPWALLTIADGDVTVLRGRARFAAVEGQRLEALDIVHTGAGTRVARLEFDDGTVLDLGPTTRVLLQPQGATWPKDRAATAYLAQGWAKLRTPPAGDAPSQGGLASATLDLAVPEGGVVLARIDAQSAFVFVESGRAQLVEHMAARAPRVFALGEGHAYARGDAAEAGAATLRPSSSLLRETPRALTDTLPRRAAEWARRAAPALGEPQAVAASDIAPWLDAEPALRPTLRARFAGAAHTAGHWPSTSNNHSAGNPASARAKPRETKPVRTARLAPTRLAVLAIAGRSSLPQTLPTDRLPAPAAVASLSPAGWPLATGVAPVLASATGTPGAAGAALKAPRSPARPRVDPYVFETPRP